MSACVDGGNSSLRAEEFEVFLSFRGPDTRLNFADCLYHSLIGVGIRVFKDNEEIRKGEKIGDELLRAIQSSKIYVPIFSRSYASSSWCLRELKHMVDSLSEANDKVIIPIFYDVNPEDVKLKTPLYLDALERQRAKFGHNHVQQWKEALMEVARIKGWHLKDKGHGEIINTFINEVLTKLMKRRRNLPDHIVGIHNHVEAVMDLLNEGSRDVNYLVIHGMGGIGKTTLASAVFNQISNQFQGYSFLLDIREFAQHGKIIDLQKQMLSEILQAKSLEIHDSVDAVTNIIRERFRAKKVLLVLDDVDKWDQLSKLAGKSEWFGSGSKIIITTRDINFLPIKEEEENSAFQAYFEEFKIYEMTEMEHSHALQLFNKHAFRMDFPPHEYKDISCKITSKTGGLPLALEVIGSSLYRKSKSFWKDTLKKLDLMPKQEVFNKLMISYDVLEHHHREIFLDIACYFIGKQRIHPHYMWKASKYFPKSELLVLSHMSLIKIVENDTLWMHDQLRDLGREIVRREDINIPGKRSRLWESKIALNVVWRKEGTENVVALRLSGLSKVHNFTSTEFSKLPNLKFLELEGGNLVGDFKHLLSKLTWLSWSCCPSKLKAKNLCLKKLAVLMLSRCDIDDDQSGWGSCLMSENLKVMQITDYPSLKGTLDLLKCPNLKRLVLQDCHSSRFKPVFPKRYDYDLCVVSSISKGVQFRHVHHSIVEITLSNSIGNLKSLCELKLDYTAITRLPHCIGDLIMLRKMSLLGSGIKKLPDSIGRLVSLLELDLRGIGITKLPASIGNLKRLEILCLDQSAIRELPMAICTLESLEKLTSSNCRNLEGEIPSEIGDLSFLKTLDLTSSKIRRLPTTMNRLSRLQRLCCNYCYEIELLPELPVSLKRLEFPSHLLWTAPNLPYLTNLLDLHICKGTARLSEFGQGALEIEWIKGITFLERLTLTLEDVTFPPVNLATLTRLRQLDITCVDPQSLMGLPSGLETLSLSYVKLPIERSLFSNLTNLSQLYLHKSQRNVVEFDSALGQHREKLHDLQLGKGELPARLSVSGLKGLQELYVYACPNVVEVHGVEKLELRKSFHISSSSSFETLPDLSELKKLQIVGLTFCPPQNLPDLHLPDTYMVVVGCGNLRAFEGYYSEWKDRQRADRGRCQ